MGNPYFRFKLFTVRHDRCAMKVTTDGCLFGAWVAAELQQEPAPLQLLDIGTGTGLLALMVAQKNTVTIEAIEIDPEAATQAQDNITSSPWASGIKVVTGDIRVTDPQKTYDVIISNPPFYQRELTAATSEKNLAHHSQELTLDQLLSIIASRLKEQGRFFLLLPCKRKTEILKLLLRHRLYPEKIVEVHPTVSHAPFRLMISGGCTETSVSISRLYIREADEQYSPEFTALMRDYYLYL